MELKNVPILIVLDSQKIMHFEFSILTLHPKFIKGFQVLIKKIHLGNSWLVFFFNEWF